MTKYITTGNKNLQSIHCSNAVINGNTVYLCGQIAIDYKSGDILRSDFKEQANTAFKNVEILLNEIGSGLDKVCMCNVYLSSMKYFDDMNEVYNQFFNKNKPARVTVGVSEIWENLDIEVSVIATI